MRRISLLGWMFLFVLFIGGCTKKVPLVDLSQVDDTFLQRCTQGPGALVVEDDLYSDYWGGGFSR